MPELAEVEFFRKQWDPGIGQTVHRIAWHPRARIFRGIPEKAFTNALAGSRLLASFSHGKQMIFQGENAWIGVHLGMTGRLTVEPPGFQPGKHDHLVLFQTRRALVFTDPRLFGRILFHEGAEAPEWWTNRPPDLLSAAFTPTALHEFLQRRKGAPIKAALLMQDRFPGIGNWMADEVLWQSRIGPSRRCGTLTPDETRSLWKSLRKICRDALRIIGRDFSDPPDSWLFLHRWKAGGSCPRCGLPLHRAAIGGRTACWCEKCQPGGR